MKSDIAAHLPRAKTSSKYFGMLKCAGTRAQYLKPSPALQNFSKAAFLDISSSELSDNSEKSQSTADLNIEAFSGAHKASKISQASAVFPLALFTFSMVA